MKYYAVYLKKNDQLLASGNSRECQRQLGLASRASFYSLVTNVKKGKNQKYEILVEEA